MRERDPWERELLAVRGDDSEVEIAALRRAVVERLEVILHLTRDLGVNLAGVEIILNMREKMGEMQSQIQEFIASLNRELVDRTVRPPVPETRTCLVPVIDLKPPSSNRRSR